MKEAHDSLAKAEKAVFDKLTNTKKSVFARFPLLFTLLGTFGAVCVFAGISGILTRIDFLRDKPVATLVFGLIILAVTGKLYKKLD